MLTRPLLRALLVLIALAMGGCTPTESDEPESNAPPIVDAGDDQQVIAGALVTLRGNASDDGNIVSYLWEQVSGATVRLNDADTPTATFVAPSTPMPLTLIFSLAITDDQDETRYDYTRVLVLPGSAPAVSAGVDRTVNEQTHVTLSGRASDTDGEIVSYLWTQTGGAAVTLSPPDQPVTTFTAPTTTSPLPLTFQLTAKDDSGLEGSDSVTITVSPVNLPPVVSAGEDQQAGEGAEVLLVGEANDPDGAISSINWQQTSGPAVTLVNADTLNASFIAPATAAPLTLAFMLNVTDNEGARSSDQITVTVIPCLNAGIRYSVYGPPYDPGAVYWATVAQEMAAKFPYAKPQAIWIVGTLIDIGTRLSFPGTSNDPNIIFLDYDANEAVLDLFDRAGISVWLQVEPGNASVEELIDLVMTQYGHHPSVVGFGVDVEWYRSTTLPGGKAVTDEEARAWVAAVRAHGDYRLFLKHWEIFMMPPTEREHIFFISDSLELGSLDNMVAEFKAWGAAFHPATVGFQYGYAEDEVWWSKLADPPGDIGRAIIANVPNVEGLYWVDFTVFSVFPPPPP